MSLGQNRRGFMFSCGLVQLRELEQVECKVKPDAAPLVIPVTRSSVEHIMPYFRAEDWRAKLVMPISADKSLQEMTDAEIEEHNRKVQETLTQRVCGGSRVQLPPRAEKQ